jgi:hypothetical protein
MTDKVVALGPVSAPTGEADPEIVAFIAQLLDAARAGEIRGIGIAYVDGGGHCVTDWHRGSVDAPMLVAAADRLHFRMSVAWDQASQ